MIIPRPLQLLLLVYFVLGLLYAAVTPPFEASDEVFHYPFVRYVAQGHGLPVQRLDVKQPWEQVAFHPPAYYYIGAALTFWIDTSDFDRLRAPNPFARIGIPGTPQNVNYTRAAARAVIEPFALHGSALAIYILRLAGLLMGAGTITFAFWLATSLFPASLQNSTALPVLAAALVAFNPEFIFISASVNNDNLTWLISAASLLIAVRLVRGPQLLGEEEIGSRPWHGWAIGVLLGIGALSKVSALALIPIVGLGLLLQAVRTRQWRRFFIDGTIIVAVVGLMSGWWFVRNQLLYNELMALEIHSKMTATRLEPYTLATFFAEWPSFWYSFWGMFGSFNILAPAWVYTFFTVLVVIGIAGGVWGMARNRARLLQADKWLWMAHGLMIIFIGATIVGLLRWNLLSYSAQGRLMFTTLTPLFTYLAAGLLAWIPLRRTALVTYVISGALVIVAAVTGVSIRSHYTPPAPMSEAQLPVDLIPLNATVAPSVVLVGYTASQPATQPGQPLKVTLYWRGLNSMATDYNLFLHVFGRDTTLIGSVDTWPGGGLRPTSFWAQGEIYADTYSIAIDPSAVAPTLLHLDIAMWETDPAQPFLITSSDGTPIGSLLVPVGALELAGPISVTPPHPTTDTFEYGIQLLGYDLPSTLTPNQQVDLVLYWQAVEPIPANYTVFVHLVNTADGTVSQADGPPAGGNWPTSYWQSNQSLADVHSISFPRAGSYRILIGLYDPESLVPLIAFHGAGTEWLDRAVELAVVTVQ